MNDLISRQAAIDIVEFECGEWSGLAKTIAEEIKQFFCPVIVIDPAVITILNCSLKSKLHGVCFCADADMGAASDCTKC